MDEEQPAAQVRNADVFAGAVTHVLSSHLSRSAAFEKRAVALLSTITAVLTFLLAALTIGDMGPMNLAVKIAGSLSLLGLVASAVFAVLTLRPLNVQLIAPARLTEMWVEQTSQPDAIVQVTAQLVRDAPEESSGKDGMNKPGVLQSAHDEAQTRAKWLSWSVWTLLAALVCLAFAAGAVLWGTMST
ncbi:MAG: hypothetical protein IPG68_09045 [Micrococcales bacterium]|nr:hypothetical protein [Micrococcales bacterium]